MRDDPSDPLFWLENQGRTLLQIADGSLAGGQLKGSDVELMRPFRQETEIFLQTLLVYFQKHSAIPKIMGFYIIRNYYQMRFKLD